MLSDKELLKQFNKHKNITDAGLSLQYDYAQRAHRFYSGDQGIYTAEITNATNDKNIIVFNKIKPFVDAISGFLRQLRRKTEYVARAADDEEQQQKSEILNVGAEYVREDANLDYYESEQDKEMIICGYGAIDSNISYEKNPDGCVKAEVIHYRDVGWDPLDTSPNVLNARWVWRRRKYSLDEALKRFKGSKPDDFDPVTDDMGRKVFNPFGGEYTAISVANSNNGEDLVEVYYYQYTQLETFYRANNPIKEMDPFLAERMINLLNLVKENRAQAEDQYVQDDLFMFDPTADTLTMSPKIKNDVVEALRNFGITLEVQEYLKRCYYTAIVSTTEVFTKFKSPNQEGYTIKIKTGDYDRELKLWYAVVRQLQEPARYANKALTEILYTIAFNSKGGVLYEKMAVDDPIRFERQYASTKAAIQVNDGALSSGAIQPKAQAALPTGFENVYQISNQSLSEVTGINKEFLGSSENKQVSALLEMQRIQQVNSILAGYCDSISLYQIEMARLMLTWMRILTENRARIISVAGKDGITRKELLHKQLLAEEYDIKIVEAQMTPAQQAETGQILLTIAAQAALLGQNLYPVVVDYIPGLRFKDKIRIQQIFNPEPDPEQVREQKQATQLIAAANKAKIEKDMADTMLKITSSDKQKAEITKTLLEAHQKDMENQLLRRVNIDNVNVSV